MMKRTAAILGLVVLIVLSIATGVTKLIRLPAEMALFQSAGFSDELTLSFGAVQVVGGLALLSHRTRGFGATIMILTFGVASWVVWLSGSPGFFVLSLSFIVLAALPLWPSFARLIRGRT